MANNNSPDNKQNISINKPESNYLDATEISESDFSEGNKQTYSNMPTFLNENKKVNASRSLNRFYPKAVIGIDAVSIDQVDKTNNLISWNFKENIRKSSTPPSEMPYGDKFNFH